MKTGKATTIIFILLLSNFAYSQNTLVWKFSTGSEVHSSAAISNDNLFFGSGDNNLYALDKRTGNLRWIYKTEGAIHSTPLVSDGRVYFNSKDGNIYSVQETTGQLLWKFQTHGEKQYDLWDYYLSSPVINDGILYIGSGDSCIYALDAQNGQCIWKHKTNGVVHATPLIAFNTVYIGSFDGNFYAIDAKTGHLKWKFKTIGDMYFPKGEIQRGAALYQNSILFGSRDYNIYALDAQTGTGRWNMKEIGSWIIATPLVIGNNIYFGTSDSHLFYCMDADGGTVKWKLPLNMRVYGTACQADENIAFGCFNGKLYFVNPENGKTISIYQTEESKQRYSTLYNQNDEFRSDFELYGKETKQSEKKILSLGSILSDPKVEGNIIYFGDANGNFYAIRIKE